MKPSSFKMSLLPSAPGQIRGVIEHTLTSTPLVAPKNFVRTLRKQGVKVRVRHFRNVRVEGPRGVFVPAEAPAHVTKMNRHHFEIGTNGGRTEVDVTLPDGESATACATCSDLDTYNKRLGVYIAANRALTQAKEAQKVKRKVIRDSLQSVQ